ncbi:MAG: L-2-amino-thiazoline-4-carboxylic acid hydrolase [Spirochaetes bacterium]|nr:L-2-amino-thiazoline-4-carboxylic acid hydrolase [Spirochaetota bacterium]MBN2770244.1 L-2-amino-thiazoline-4-carboxylic acid hydrolase [Spirochaetota bacterium]
MNRKEAFSIDKRSKTGSEWETFNFEQLASKIPFDEKPYKVNVLSYLKSLYIIIVHNSGKITGTILFVKVLLIDLVFNKPKWDRSKFDISSKAQEVFYKKKFNENIPVIAFYYALSKKTGKDKADRIIAETMVPVVLEMMKSKYHPVANIESVEVWLKQARNYLGSEIEIDKGFEGEIYLAKDKSELRFHVTRCAPMQILREYGLIYTATVLCMCDHITYHTIFPNMIFKRTHTLAMGDEFCDHEFRVRKNNEPIMDEDNYSDCARDPEIRQFVKEWEDR